MYDDDTFDINKILEEEKKDALSKFNEMLEKEKNNESSIEHNKHIEEIDKIDKEIKEFEKTLTSIPLVDEESEIENIGETEEVIEDEEEIIEAEEIIEEEIEKKDKTKTKKVDILKIFSIMVIIIVIIFTLFILSKCTGTSLTDCKVEFDTDDGSKVVTQEIKCNKKASIPIEPTKLGYVFDGWYLNGKPFDFNTEVKKNIKLKASWKKQENQPISGIVIDQTEATITPNSSVKLIASVIPFSLDNDGFIWKSSNENIAVVDENGKVTGKIEGKTIITATTSDGKYTAECVVTVSKNVVKVTGVSLNKNSLTMSTNEEFELRVNIMPMNATNKGVIWSSSDENVVRVTNGKIIAVNEGNAVVKVTTKDGNYKAETSIVVKNIPLTGIKIINYRDMVVGNKISLSISYSPLNASNKGVIWSSSNTNILTIDNNGLVVAKSSGSATITAKSKEGNYSDNVTINVSQATPVSSINLNKTELKLKVGESEKLVVSILPTNANDKTIIWKSSNEDVVKVENGNVVALKPGVANIIASNSSGKISSNCKVIVEQIEIEKVYTYVVTENTGEIGTVPIYKINVYENGVDVTNKIKKFNGVFNNGNDNIVIDYNEYSKLSQSVEIVIDGETKSATKA